MDLRDILRGGRGSGVITSNHQKETTMPMISVTNYFVGTWNTSWTNASGSSSEMRINENGTATFNWKGGELTGKFDEANQVYKGLWKQADGSVGEFHFRLQGGATSFEGTYSFTAPAGTGGLWVGTKK
jgi:hypothetical protein